MPGLQDLWLDRKQGQKVKTRENKVWVWHLRWQGESQITNSYSSISRESLQVKTALSWILKILYGRSNHVPTVLNFASSPHSICEPREVMSLASETEEEEEEEEEPGWVWATSPDLCLYFLTRGDRIVPIL